MSLKTIDGESRVYSGRSRSGKTAKCKIDVDAGNFPAVFVFDIEEQWCKMPGYKRVTSMAEFKNICKKGLKGKFAFVPTGDLKPQFEQFCMCVFHYANYFGHSAVVGEEMADVTNTSKAPPYWGAICRRGLKRGLHIFSISQRWAEADKTCMGNASKIFIFQPATMADAKYLSDRVNVDVMTVFNLDYDGYEYIEANLSNRKNTVKNLPFPRKKPEN